MKFSRIFSLMIVMISIITLILFWGFGVYPLFAEYLSPRVSGDKIIFENNLVSYVIGKDGLNKAFVDKRSGKDYLDKNFQSNFMSIDLGRGYIGASKIEYANNYLFVTFGIEDICARIHLRILPRYITFELISIDDQSVREFQLANIPLTNTKFIGSSLTNTRDEDFAGCLIPLNIETISRAKKEKMFSNSLIGWCESRVKLEGGKIAVIGCPTEQLLDVIEQVEIENGLPHPTIGGVWARKANEIRHSYLFIDYSEYTIAEVIDYALKGGFGYIMVYGGTWNSSHGSYTINKSNFPHGEVGLKEAVDKIHAAGLKSGIHIMDRLISKTDTLIHPIPPPGLLKRWENERTLEKDIEEFETFIPVTTSPKGFLEKSGKSRSYNRDIQIDNEIITYDDIQTTTPYGFIGCTRGAYGTHPAKHNAGSKIEDIAECWGFFEPDIESDLSDIVLSKLAWVMDYCGFDMIYPDAIGGSGRGPSWYMTNIGVNKLYNYTKREILWAHYPVCNWAWHIFVRGNTTDFVTRGVVEHFDIVSINNSRGGVANLQPFEFGWFGLFEKRIDRHATIPREIEYAYSKTCAYNCAMSIETNISSFRENGRSEELLIIMKNWEELKFDNYFSVNAIKKIQEKGKEFTLDKNAQGSPVARQIIYGPEKYIDKINGTDNSWTFENTFDSQPLRVLIKSMPLLADYGDPENIVLMKPGKLNIVTSPQGPRGRGRKSEGMSFDLSISDEQVKIGNKSIKISAVNNSDNPDGWGCVEIIMDKVYDISRNRSIGTWIYGDGSGIPLHFMVEDVSRWAIRDWWVKLDFKGWKYVKIPEPAKGEVYRFKYPYSNYWPIRHINYSKVERVYVFLTNIPSGQDVTCYFSQLEALKEKQSTIKYPKITIGSQTIIFPVTLKKEDYLEFNGSGKYHTFNAEGHTIVEKNITGSIPTVNAGSNTVSFNCDFFDPDGQAAMVEIITLGEPFK